MRVGGVGAAAEVLFEDADGAFGIAGAIGGEEEAVLGVEVVADAADSEEGHEVGEGETCEAIAHSLKNGHGCRSVENAVKLEVEFGPLPGIGGSLHGVGKLGGAFEIEGGEAGNGGADEFAIDEAVDLGDDAAFVGVKDGDVGAATGLDGDEAVAFEKTESLPERNAADAEAFGEDDLGEAFTGLELAGDDEFAELLGGALRERAAIGRRVALLGGLGWFFTHELVMYTLRGVGAMGRFVAGGTWDSF